MSLSRFAALLIAVYCMQNAMAGSAGLDVPGTPNYPNNSVVIARSDSVFLPGENNSYCVAYNPATNMALFGINSTSPNATVVQVDMGSLSTPPTRVGAVMLNAGEIQLVTASLDTVNNVVLFSTDTSPSQIIKVAFGTGGNPPTRVGALTLNSGEDRVYAAVIDPASNQALFGCFTSSPNVVKVAINGAGAAPTRVSALTLSGEGALGAAVFNPATGEALFGTYVSPAHIVKVAIGPPASVPTLVGTPVILQTGENLIVGAAQDVASGTAVFGTLTSPGILVKAAVGDVGGSPSRVGAMTLNTGENGLYSVAIDNASGTVMCATLNSTSAAVKLNLNAAAAAPTRVASAAYALGQSNFVGSFYDSAAGRFVFVPSIGSDTKIHSVLHSPQGAVRGTKVTLTENAAVADVRMYTHAAGSTVRMAIYDANYTLLWQSTSASATVANGEVSVPISAGTPASLSLTAGTYFVAYQSSAAVSAPSLTQGTPGDGFDFYQSFGSFTTPLPPANVVSTDARYTQYFTYSTGAGLNIADGDPAVVNPLNGIKISVANSNGGLITLAIDVSSVERAPTTASTDFSDIPGRSSIAVPGLSPSHMYTQPGVFVATSTGIDVPTGTPTGKMRKQLVVSSRETNASGLQLLPPSTEIEFKSLKGKFLFTKETPDQVTFAGSITLPAGLDLSVAEGLTLSLGIGNITDDIVISPKGKGQTPGAQGRVKSAKVKYPRLAKGKTVTAGGEVAQVQVTLNTADMDINGFDTEGITPTLATGEDPKKAASRNIQLALVLGGVPYETLAPVQFKVSSKMDAGTLTGRAVIKK